MRYLSKISLVFGLPTQITNVENSILSPLNWLCNFVKNKEIIELIKSMGVNVKNILENCGNILTINPEIILRNIRLLKQFT